MKNFSIIFVLSILMCSCSVNSTLTDSEIEGKWQLVRVTSGMISNPPVSEPSYKEYYFLKNNGTFTKTRIVENEEINASGTYKVSKEEAFEGREPRKTLLLTYDSENELIENCSATPTEFLVFQNDNVFFNSWIACDGPTLEYEKVE